MGTLKGLPRRWVSAAAVIVGLTLAPVSVARATAPVVYVSGAGLTDSFGLATDSANNLYVSDGTNGNIYKVAPTTPHTLVQIGQVPGGVTGIAIDAAGNVFVVGGISAPSGVFKLTLQANGSYSNPVLVRQDSAAAGVAVDQSGNVYYNDYSRFGGDALHKLTLDASDPSGNSYTDTIIANGLIQATETRVDVAGNVYVVENPNGFNVGASSQIDKFTPGANGTYVKSIIAMPTGSGFVAGLAVDPAGQVVVIGEFQNGNVVQISIDGSQTQTLIASGLNDNGHTVERVALDTFGDVFVANDSPNVYEIVQAVTLPPNEPGTTTPELGSGGLLATGLLPIGAILLYRRRSCRQGQHPK